MQKKAKAEFIENYLIIWNPEQGSEIFSLGFYGKPLGISKPKTANFEVPLILDLMEGLHLLDKGQLEVYEMSKNFSKKRNVKPSTLRNRARKIYDDFDLKYIVYSDLRDQGLVVAPGVKYGCDFAVYEQGPGIDHAPYMVSVKSQHGSFTATDVVKAGRLATTVRKRFIIAVPDLSKRKIEYFIFKWFRA